MDVKKSELYSPFWSTRNELLGGMDLLFIKHISDKYAGLPSEVVPVV